ncbi:MAG TPA: hypothetical protein VD994_11540 [Prosthecobacter sp.]|nr:hypothetical protein [Prosthecobacter sp.]
MHEDLLRRYLENGGTIKRILPGGQARAIGLRNGETVDLGPVELPPMSPEDREYLTQWGKPL